MPDAWKRAALRKLNCDEDDLFAVPALQVIEEFSASQNLTLPPGSTWRTVAANVFSVVDGKSILFGNDDSLFHQLRDLSPSGRHPSVELIREQVALCMLPDELHDYVHRFMNKLDALTMQ